MKRLMLIALAGLAGCTTAPNPATVSPLPDDVLAVITAERPGFVYDEHERKDRDGRTYYDVEGTNGDGAEIEFDVLMTDRGPRIVEIQRDLDWSDVPAEVRAMALEASGGAEPVRIIESVQTDGAVIYELFADGQPSDPAFEVRVLGGEVELLTERWIH